MNKIKNLNRYLSKGFTLIELLIVIAVLGVLAAVVLVAIDPVQQLARGRDAGRKSTIGQLGRAMQAYYTSTGVYPPETGVNSWMGSPVSPANNILVTSGEIKSFPANPAYAVPGAGIPCSPNNVNGYCFDASATEIVIFARMESKSVISNCPAGSPTAWYVFSSAAGRSGGTCGTGATAPVPGITTFVF